MIVWKPVATFHGRVNEPVLLTDGTLIAHGTWEQVPNQSHPPRWNTWAGTPLPHAYDGSDHRGESPAEWIGYEGVYPFEPTHWAEPINRPATS